LLRPSGWRQLLDDPRYCGWLGSGWSGGPFRRFRLSYFNGWYFDGLGDRSFWLFNDRGLFDRARRLLHNLDRALNGDLFLGEVLVANLLRKLFGDRVRRHAHIHTFASHLFDEPLGVELKFFSQVVNTNL
jgi:hypothetical protein